ncbi:MAG: hypothetical protein FWE89_05935 [Syntrophaceae bacterium]|nr:hypothetical protein [Syntrophaceae bacterium]
MVITRSGFRQVVANAFAGLGFPAEGPTVYEFPMQMFESGSDLTPLRENIDKVVYGLTKWQPTIKTKGVISPPMVTVQGADYQNALDNMNLLFVNNMWSDGMPVMPATEARVKWILTGTDLAPDTVISPPGGVVPRGGIATVEAIAVTLAMAGGRPEYLPLLIASVQAITDPAWGLQAANSTTGSVFPAIVVNGPMARQIRLASGYGMLGPDPGHPAGAVVGRALRFVMQGLGGAIPGVGTMSIYGGMRLNNAIFAEDEEGLPKGWDSVAVERGFKPEQNVVTATPVGGMNQTIAGEGFWGTKEGNHQTLVEYAKVMSIPGDGPNMRASRNNNPDYASGGVIFMGRTMAANLASVSGYTKLDAKKIIWEHAKLPWSTIVAIGRAPNFIKAGAKEGEDFHVTPIPEQLMIVMAGGDQAGHGLVLPAGGNSGYRKVSKEIRLPKNWDALIKQAEMDLGPIPLR